MNPCSIWRDFVLLKYVNYRHRNVLFPLCSLKTTYISWKDHVKCVFTYMEWFLMSLKIESKVNLIF